jgi:hypothetical protein
MKERTLEPQQTKPINNERGRTNIPDDKQMLEDLRMLYHYLPLQVLIISNRPEDREV